MRKALTAVALCLPVLVGGCVYTIHPLYEEADITFDLGLAGTWAEVGSTEKVQFIPTDDSSYVVILTDEDGNAGRFVGRQFSFEGLTFLDFYPERSENKESDAYRDHFVPVHSVMTAYRDGSQLELRSLDYESLEDYLELHDTAVGFTKLESSILLTSSTKVLQGFLASFFNTSEAFGETVVLHRLPLGR